MSEFETEKKELFDAMVAYNKANLLATVDKARSAGMDPLAIIEVLGTGMTEVGVRFERGKLFLPHVLSAADAMTAAVKVLEADLPKEAASSKIASVVIGTVEGDVHDIGKSIVSTLLQCAGFDVHDLGRDVPIPKFINEIRNGCTMIGMSSLMTTSMVVQRDAIEKLKEEGLRDSVKVLVGGAPATQAWADKIGADGYGENANDAVQVALALAKK